MAEMIQSEGNPVPYGASSQEGGVNFALYSRHAEEVTLLLYDLERKVIGEFVFDRNNNKTGDVWHTFITNIPDNSCYAFKIKQKGRYTKFYENVETPVLDPYAKAVFARQEWGDDKVPYQPLGCILKDPSFDWQNDKPLKIPMEETIIYEMHVRGFTKHSSSNVKDAGTYLGIIEKIPYLLDLGVNAVELLPIHEFNECEFKRYNIFNGSRLFNYWGYSTVNFFSPMSRYAASKDFASCVKEFKTMVRELHKNGIEVILDVVFNHTAEGNEFGPTLSFKGIDLPVYYMLDSRSKFMDFTGCGNTFNSNHPIVREMIIDCLHYWVSEMHVDGFRFDLATIMNRGTKGEALGLSPLIEEISEDPLLADTKLIAEPWDVQGLYKLGQFNPDEERWSEWNDQYRDTMRRFIKGDRGVNRDFARRFCGSDDIFGNRSPKASINFITAHDGFTLRDLVSYNQKHNSANGEDDRDGNPNNLSWNSGVEGETKDPAILRLRLRQMKNFHLALMLSQGVPMLLMGDEYGHTRYGNNNSWCQDNDLNWFLWDELEAKKDYYRFYKGLISLRKKYPIFRMGRFLTNEDVDWHSKKPYFPNWEEETKFIACTFKDDRENGHYFYAAFNACETDTQAQLPQPPKGQRWYLIVNTANTSPDDLFDDDEKAPVLASNRFPVKRHSSILLKAF
ncbi:glycogen debranching protein GlgX [Criblamydia sequanensis]|uniref:Glycogen debranching enzyme n=1 Tax=Candidatus Criblamydia sequanensis CRIB-18 TaxID=1437425 RepID=A0A090D0S7_9BACT|nr:glycogen debranching protein GlgX [Criblamydia sequanensis]CDR34941.1 Glycogen debranching enzyme [Criblamydia sequanensis CRIB-18]